MSPKLPRRAMSQFIHQHHARVAGQDRIDVELLESRPPIMDLARCHAFQRVQHGVGIGSSMSLCESDDNVAPTFGEASSLVEHREGLARPRCDAKEDVQTSR